jgi:hypothetical protein
VNVGPIAHLPRIARLDAIDATDAESPSMTRRLALGTARRPLAPFSSSRRRPARVMRVENVDTFALIAIARATTMDTIARARTTRRGLRRVASDVDDFTDDDAISRHSASTPSIDRPSIGDGDTTWRPRARRARGDRKRATTAPRTPRRACASTFICGKC